MHRLLVSVVSVSLAFATCRDAAAQSLFGDSGPIAQTQAGTLANPPTGGAGGLQSGAAGGGTGAFQSNITTELGALSGTIGQGFVGRSDNMGQFIGNRMAGQQSANQFNSGLGAAFGNRGRESFNNQSQGRNSSSQQARMIRPRLQTAFSHPSLAVPTIETRLESRFAKLASRESFPGDVEISIDDEQVVTLRGAVESDGERKLAEMLVRLEPGVRDVNNELTVR